MWAYLSIVALLGLPVLVVIGINRSRSQPVVVRRRDWPVEGARFRAVTPIEVDALTTWTEPYGGDNRTLPAGEEFVVLRTPTESETTVPCRPVRYEDLHSHFVRFADRSSAEYTGYCIVMRIEQLKTCCEALGQSRSGSPQAA